MELNLEGVVLSIYRLYSPLLVCLRNNSANRAPCSLPGSLTARTSTARIVRRRYTVVTWLLRRTMLRPALRRGLTCIAFILLTEL